MGQITQNTKLDSQFIKSFVLIYIKSEWREDFAGF